MLSMAVRTCSTSRIWRRVSRAPVRLIANWAMTAASAAVSVVSETVEMMAAAQLCAKLNSAPKASAKLTRPTKTTSEEARLKLSEKNILSLYLGGWRRSRIIPLPAFFAVNWW